MSDTQIFRPNANSGRFFGKYEMVSVLGEGGMGVVYQCRDPDLERFVAVKTIHKDLLEGELGEELLSRFRNEMLATSRLAHQNIVTVFDAGAIDGSPYFVMEFVEGRELAQFLKEGVRFPLQESLKIITQILSGLAYTHKLGVVHRDLKPANIFLTPSGTVKIADFGIAKLESSELTKVGTILGSPRYMSPEQCVGEAVDNRSDLFSAGIIFYELLTGEHCFNANASHTVIHKIINAVPEPPTALNPALPKAFDKVIEKALAKRPQDRFQSAEEFMQAVRDAELLLVSSSPSASRRWPWIAGVGVATAAFVSAAVFMSQQGPAPAPANQVLDTAAAVSGPAVIQPQPSVALVEPDRSVQVLTPDKLEKIERLLKVAGAHERIGRLVIPSGSNAFDAYQLVLEIDPSNPQAKTGIESVRQRLLSQSLELIENGELEQARANLEAGLSDFPGEAELVRLQQDLLAKSR